MYIYIYAALYTFKQQSFTNPFLRIPRPHRNQSPYRPNKVCLTNFRQMMAMCFVICTSVYLFIRFSARIWGVESDPDYYMFVCWIPMITIHVLIGVILFHAILILLVLWPCESTMYIPCLSHIVGLKMLKNPQYTSIVHDLTRKYPHENSHENPLVFSIIELHHGNILTRNPDQFDGKNSMVSC